MLKSDDDAERTLREMTRPMRGYEPPKNGWLECVGDVAAVLLAFAGVAAVMLFVIDVLESIK